MLLKAVEEPANFITVYVCARVCV